PSVHASVESAGAFPENTTRRSPKSSSTAASATGTKAGPGVRRLPKGRRRLSHTTNRASSASAPPATRSVVSIIPLAARGERPPDAFGRERHVQVADAERRKRV